MQTGEEKIGFDIECPQCDYRFTLVEPGERQLEPTIARESPAPPTEPATDSESTRHRITEADIEPTAKPAAPEEAFRMPGTISPVYQGDANHGWRCRYCSTRQPPMWKSEISTVGWIVLAILLVTTCIFFWVGLLIRNKYPVCSVCKVRLPKFDH